MYYYILLRTTTIYYYVLLHTTTMYCYHHSSFRCRLCVLLYTTTAYYQYVLLLYVKQYILYSNLKQNSASEEQNIQIEMAYDGSATQYIRRLIQIIYDKEVQLQKLRKKSSSCTQSTFNEELKHTIFHTSTQIKSATVQITNLQSKIQLLQHDLEEEELRNSQSEAHFTQLLAEKDAHIHALEAELCAKVQAVEAKKERVEEMLRVNEQFAYEVSAKIDIVYEKYCRRGEGQSRIIDLSKKLERAVNNFDCIIGQFQRRLKESQFRVETVQGLSMIKGCSLEHMNIEEDQIQEQEYQKMEHEFIQKMENSIEMSKANKREEIEEMEQKYKIIKEINEQLFNEVNQKEIMLGTCRKIVENMVGKKEEITKLRSILLI